MLSPSGPTLHSWALPRAVSGGLPTGRAAPKRTAVAPRLLPQRGQPVGWEEVVVRGLPSQGPTAWCLSGAWSTLFTGSCVLVPVAPLDHATPTHDAVGQVLQGYSCMRESNWQGARALHPLAQATGFLAHFL